MTGKLPYITDFKKDKSKQWIFFSLLDLHTKKINLISRVATMEKIAFLYVWGIPKLVQPFW